jgi:hypothetical protein
MHTYTASIFDTPDAWTDARMTALRDDMRAGRIPAYCQGCSALYEDYMGL